MSEWRTFDTAPKDGSLFLAFDGDDGGGVSCGVVLAYWYFDDQPDDFDDDMEPHWEVSALGTGDCLDGCNLTHWMPLPEPPKAS